MKLLIFATVLGVCSAGLLPQTYLPPTSSGHFSGGSGSYSSGSSSFGGSTGYNTGSASYNSGAYQGGSGGHGAGSYQSGSGAYQGAGGHQGGSGAYQGAGAYQGSGSYQGSGGYNSGAGAYHGGSSRPQDANAQILRANSDVNEHGFSYEYETSNGIRAHAQGEATHGVQSQGAFSYKGDDGHDYSITYTADENGYRPQGAHLPTSPPVPEAILRSLEQNARDEAAGIHDDGSYHESGAGSYSGAGQHSAGQYSAGQYSSGQYSGPSNQYLTPQQTHRTQPSYNSQSGYHY